MNEHRITCEVCGTETTKGIIVKDKALRDRYFCSDKCLNEKIEEQEKEWEEMNTPFWKKIFRRKQGGVKDE